MKLKTYQATSINAALKLARIELGEDALFLGADERPADGAATPDRRFHATFGVSEDGDSPAVDADHASVLQPYWKRTARARPPAANSSSGAPRRLVGQALPLSAPVQESPVQHPEPFDRIRREIQELRRELEQRVQPRSSWSGADSWSGASALRFSLLALLFDRLTARGVAPAHAAELVAPLEPAAESGADLDALCDQLRRRISDAWRITPAPDHQGLRVVAFVGPTGAGKTTVVAKTAVRAARRGAAVRLLSVDQPRIGAAQTLELFADLIDAPVSFVEDACDLPVAVAEAVRDAARGEAETTVLIDTRGYGPSEDDAFRTLADSFNGIEDLEVHLVIHPGLHPSDLDRETSRYAPLRPAAAVFSRLDETAAPAAVWNVYRRLGAPVSYLSEGPRIPEDLRRATPALLTDWVLPQECRN